MDDGDRVLTILEAHLVSVLGVDSGRAGVSFVGTDRVDVLRFGPGRDGVVRYVTLGMSRAPMAAAAAVTVDPDGPRAELVLTLLGRRDGALNQLGVLACVPAVEGMVIAPGARLELGVPLWPDAPFEAVVVGFPDPAVPGLDDPPVDLLPVLPVTPNELAWARVHGTAALLDRWISDGTDLRDPARAAVDLRSPGERPG